MTEKDQELIVQKFERTKAIVGDNLAAMLLWNELPNKIKKSFDLGTLFSLYRNIPAGNPNKLSLREEIFTREGTYGEWKEISEHSDDDPELKSWATKKMAATVEKRFPYYLSQYKQGSDVIDELILSTTTQKERFEAYKSARNEEDKVRLKQILFEGMHSVDDYIAYAYWSNDTSILNKVEHAILPHKEWTRLYHEYGSRFGTPEDLFVFLFHKHCQTVRGFYEAVNTLDYERYSVRTTETNQRISKDLSRVRLIAIRMARSPGEFRILFHNIFWYREEVREIIKAFRKRPKLGFAKLAELHDRTHSYNNELKDFLAEEMFGRDLSFTEKIELWEIEKSRALLWRIFNDAETLAENAAVYNLYFWFNADEPESTIKPRVFAQMQILASQ